MKKTILTALAGMAVMSGVAFAENTKIVKTEAYNQGFEAGCQSARTNHSVLDKDMMLSSKDYKVGVKDSKLLCSGTDAPS